jgi:lipid-A-disaccharide synthase
MRIFLIAGETSGDQLGGALMRALDEACPEVAFCGVGGEAMTAAGLVSLYPLDELAVMGFVPVLRHLPRLLKRIDETAAAVVAARPDALIIIDSPDFTHRVARRVRRRLPQVPIIDYVSPTVWAWRSGRARRMCAYIDHVLALLPFEPDAYRRLGGPPCSYVGHPLVERLEDLTPRPEDLHRRNQEPPVLVVLPGSRHSEIDRLMPVFARTLPLLTEQAGPFEAVIPAVPHLMARIKAEITDWPIKPSVISSEAAKFASFRQARAALAASGTVTLELALAGVPMAVAYRVAPLESLLRFVIKVPSIVLPNLILGESLVPEFLQEACTPEALAGALVSLLRDGRDRDRQSRGLAEVAQRLRVAGGQTPSNCAVAIIFQTIARKAGRDHGKSFGK